MTLTSREKLLLLVLAVVLACGMFVLAWQRIAEYRLDVRREVERQERLLRQVRVAAQQLDAARQRPASPLGRASLLGQLEQLATRLSLRDSLQLNQIAQTGSPNVEGVEVRLDNLSLDDLVAFVHAIEHSEPMLLIDRLEVSPNFRSRELLRLTARVLAEK
ncbi:MAG: type II secretion system protein M [Candidatus Lambdaproteobacteria bacterium]|nr:type II secretion system protein M [Candidatus Lambdaproteobacteria bacterium]